MIAYLYMVCIWRLKRNTVLYTNEAKCSSAGFFSHGLCRVYSIIYFGPSMNGKLHVKTRMIRYGFEITSASIISFQQKRLLPPIKSSAVIYTEAE